MSAPQIPNLLTLRGRGGRTRLRGGRDRARGTGPEGARGGGRGGWEGGAGAAGTSARPGQGHAGGASGPAPNFMQDSQEMSGEERQRREDEVVRRTDDDANASRLSAVAIGLLDDPFAGYFGDLANAPRRMPIINRGTCVRTLAIDKLVHSFLDDCAANGSTAQIISLGAGSDTRFFNLVHRGAKNFKYHEIDFVENARAKLACIDRNPELREILTGSRDGEVTGRLPVGPQNGDYEYQIHGLDLRLLSTIPISDDSVVSSLTRISRNAPSLIISECCLCYLKPTVVGGILRYFIGPEANVLSTSSPVGLIFYEPVNPHDSFGAIMIRNLHERGIEMPTLSAFPTLESQRARFQHYGLGDGARATTIYRILTSWLTEAEKRHMDTKDPLDELEEWHMLAQHYCISWGWRGSLPWSQWQRLVE